MIRCPDWQRLLRHRFEDGLETPEDLPEALQHLEGCDGCRIEAYGQDPSLIFLDLPAVTVPADEIERMKAAVATLRQGLAIAANDSSAARDLPARSGSIRGQLRRSGWWRTAAAVLLVAGLGTALWTGLEPASEGVETSVLQEDIGARYGAGVMPASLRDAPILEDVGGPHARVYNYPIAPEEKIALVMVIDPDLDV
jgi:hypothetical protein